MTNSYKEFGTFSWRITSAHIITYFIIGLLSMLIFSYNEIYSEGEMQTAMKPLDSPWVMAGPALQIFRGIMFSIVLWPFRSIFLGSQNGWLKLWGLFLGLAILGTTGPAPGSLEGIIYTNYPVLGQIIGLRETLLQTFIFSLVIFYWYKNSKKLWNYSSAILTGIIFLMILGGLLQQLFK